MIAAQGRADWRVPLAAYAPVAVTRRYSGLIVTWRSGEPPLPDSMRDRRVYPVPGVKFSPILVSTPTAPRRSSSVTVVAAVEPDEADAVLPDWLAVRSTLPIPLNSAALTAFETTLFSKVTVMVSLV